ncbi:MAG: hypothetical protein JKY68_08050 [Rhodospirillales bacterium]|nr:hypothetical protein [Rhodospirillales bacterium]
MKNKVILAIASIMIMFSGNLFAGEIDLTCYSYAGAVVNGDKTVVISNIFTYQDQSGSVTTGNRTAGCPHNNGMISRNFSRHLNSMGIKAKTFLRVNKSKPNAAYIMRKRQKHLDYQWKGGYRSIEISGYEFDPHSPAKEPASRIKARAKRAEEIKQMIAASTAKKASEVKRAIEEKKARLNEICSKFKNGFRCNDACIYHEKFKNCKSVDR